MDAQKTRVATFQRLHAAGCFVMMNPFDIGSARVMEQLGFQALATTSAGFAWTRGRADDDVSLGEALEHARALVDAVTVPVNVDFKDGYAVQPHDLGANVKSLVATGAAGFSIEDSSGDPADPLYEFDLAVERVKATRAAIDETGTGVVFTARSEGFVCGRPDIDETIRRLRAYSEAGADCLYAPRIGDLGQIAAIVAAVSPKPVNLLINAPFITVAEAEALGVRRISAGGTLARTAWAGVLEAAREIATSGTFSRFSQLPDVESLLAGMGSMTETPNESPRL